MDNPDQLATYGTQDGDKQNKNTTQCVLDTTMRKQTHIMVINCYDRATVSFLNLLTSI